MPSSSAQVRFGPFAFDPSTGELTGDGAQTRLAPQVAAVLALLIRRSGEVVTRAALREAVWPDTTVEFDQGLNFCIRQLRIALSDDAAQPKYIETLPKRGYRFIGRIATSGARETPGVAEPREDPVQPVPSRARLSRATRGAATAAVLAALAIVAFVAQRRSTRAADAPSLAVLRFDADPVDSSLDQYRLNLTEQIVTALSAERTNELAVMGPTFTARFPGMQTDPDSLRVALRATHSLSGSLRRTPTGTRVFAQLIRLGDRRHIYAAVLIDSTNTAARMSAIAESIRRGVTHEILGNKP
jgi:DNA-binding winged helix-turn-helix (wHTH) protein/TolB-like protein